MGCSGAVQIDVEGKAEAERAAKNLDGTAGQKVHVETSGMAFNRATGMARTDQPVKFVFQNGSGEAVGVEYHSEEGAMRLLKDVRLSLLAPPTNGTAGRKTPSAGSQEPVPLTGNTLHFQTHPPTMQLPA